MPACNQNKNKQTKKKCATNMRFGLDCHNGQEKYFHVHYKDNFKMIASLATTLQFGSIKGW